MVAFEAYSGEDGLGAIFQEISGPTNPIYKLYNYLLFSVFFWKIKDF